MLRAFKTICQQCWNNNGEIRHFHVVVVQWTPKKCTKRSDARAVVVLLNYLLFEYFFLLGVVVLLINPCCCFFIIFFDVVLVAAVVVFKKVPSVLTTCTRERLGLGDVFV